MEGEPQEGKLAYQELKQLGVYQVKRTPDDNYGYIAFKDFVEDPEATERAAEQAVEALPLGGEGQDDVGVAGGRGKELGMGHHHVHLAMGLDM